MERRGASGCFCSGEHGCSVARAGPPQCCWSSLSCTRWAWWWLLWSVGLLSARNTVSSFVTLSSEPVAWTINGCGHYQYVQMRLGIFSVQVDPWRDASFCFTDSAEPWFSHTHPFFPASGQARGEWWMKEAACNSVTKWDISILWNMLQVRYWASQNKLQSKPIQGQAATANIWGKYKSCPESPWGCALWRGSGHHRSSAGYPGGLFLNEKHSNPPYAAET